MTLSNDAMKLLKEKAYFQDGESTWEDLCNRVALAITSPEKVEEEKNKVYYQVYNALIDTDFIFSTPVLLNANEKTGGNLSSCIAGSMPIYTADGIKLMKDIKIGDYVLTGNQNFKKVLNVWSNGIKNVISIRHGMTTRKNMKMENTLLCTPEHKMLNFEKEWVESKDLTKITFPQIWKTDVPSPEFFEMDEFFYGYGSGNKKIEITNENKIKIYNLHKGVWKENIQLNKCKKTIENDIRLAKLFGEYLANGSVTGNQVRFTINALKKDLIEELAGYIEDIFNVKVTFDRNSKGWTHISTENIFIKNLFTSEFGKGCHNKKFPLWIANSSEEYKSAICDYLFHDGTTVVMPSGYVRKILVLANPTLLYQYVLIQRNLGENVRFYYSSNNSLSKHQTSRAVVGDIDSSNNVIIVSENISAEVFDMEIEDDHSFIANDYIAHNCFILSTKDNIEDICKLDAEFAKIFQQNGGAGTDLSVLRPMKSAVNASKGYAGGVVTFMEKYDATADQMTRYNPSRKGALKINLQVWHPDIFLFIHAKDDLSKLNRMNISISLTDSFMQAVKNDEQWDLEFPDYENNKSVYDKEWDGDLDKWKSKNYPVKKYQTIKASKLLKEISECAWKSGEPGFNFQDTMDKDNPNKHLGTKVYTNPCFSGDTLLLTNDGYKTFEHLSQFEQYNIIDAMGNSVIGKVKSTGIKNSIILNLSNKKQIRCTPNHLFKTVEGTEVEAIEIKGKRILPYLKYKTLDSYFTLLGFIQGDGNLSRIKSLTHRGIEVNIGKNDQDILELIEGHKFTVSNRKIYLQDVKDDLIKMEFSSETLPTRNFPNTFCDWDKNLKASFLRGCFSANGSINNYGRITYKATSHGFIENLKKYLENYFGIKSYITTNKSHKVKFSNGDYIVKESYDLNISQFESKLIFYNEINFYQKYKIEKLKNKTLEMSPKVISIKNCGEIEVFDFYLSDYHWGVVEGFVAHNCSEFSNIPLSSCNLGSINILNYIKNGKLDKERLSKTSYEMIRWFDNMISINKLPLKSIDDITKKIRPIGAGIMGIADAMYSLGIKYNSTAGYDFAKEIITTIKKSTTKASIDLAEERGAYPSWVGSEWEKKGIKIRNSTLLSIAPNGSISFLAGVSGGCEPNYALCYTRRTYDGTNYYIINDIFKKKLEEIGIYSDELMDKISKNNGSCKGIKEVPQDIQDVFVVASDLTPEEHLNFVSVLQKHVDLSISKTCNMSNSSTSKDISNIIMYAWDQGLKGFTIYRDGSRDNQTLSTASTYTKEDDEQNFKFDYINPPAKEDIGETFGTTVKKKVACGSLYITLNRDKEGNIVETFIMTGKGGICQSNINAVSRLSSLALRSGVKLDVIEDQLSNIKCPACSILKSQGKELERSCPDAIAQYLKEKHEQGATVIKETTPKKKGTSKPDNKMTCPNCGEKMRLEAGCVICVCGFSKCG